MDGARQEEEKEEAAALSDFEEDDLEAAPVVLPGASSSSTNNHNHNNINAADALKSALAELDSERQTRKALEAARSDADSTAARLKSYIHEAIRQRDEALRLKDEALRAKEERSKQLEEALRSKDEYASQRDEILRQKDEISRARDSARAEIEGVAFILVTQAEKVTSMANSVKSFPGGLPRVPKSTGLAAIALGFAKRVEEVVEEVLRQREDALKRRDESHAQMEQRNFSTAIEISQLEASITQLKEEVVKKSSDVERWQKLAAGKDGRIAEIEAAMLEKLEKTKQEAEMLKERVGEVEGRLQAVNSEIAQSAEYIAKAKGHLLDVLRLVQFENSAVSLQTDWAASEHDGDVDEHLHKEVLAEGHEIVELASRVLVIWKENQQKVERERKDWESTVRKAVEEKSEILHKLSFPDHETVASRDSKLALMNGTDDSRDRELLNSTPNDEQADETDENDPGVCMEGGPERYKIIGEVRQQTSLQLFQAELAAHEKRNDQNIAKMELLEEDVKNLRQELERTASTSRLEIDRLQHLLAHQGKDLAGKVARISELERHVESLTGELLVVEEEVARWKEAATAEAAAGKAMLEEVEMRNEEIAALNERMTELRELMEEANSKVGSKEEMAMAAIAARNAAERSLQIADERAGDLRYRIEEMSKQLEEYEQKGDYPGRGLLDMCWPWLRGRGRPGLNRPGQGAHSSAEMAELLEPLV